MDKARDKHSRKCWKWDKKIARSLSAKLTCQRVTAYSCGKTKLLDVTHLTIFLIVHMRQ